LLVVVGTLLLLLPVSGSHRPLTWREAFFTAVSALSTTGLSIITPGSDLSRTGQMVLILLMQAGGVGFMVLAVTIFRLLGRRVTLAERVALRDSLGLISSESLLVLTQSVLQGVLLVEALGALALWLLWQPHFGVGEAAYLAVFHSVSAFCNASFDLFSGRPDAPAGFPTDAGTLLVISALIIAGSLGIPVIADLTSWRRRRMSLHTRLTLPTVAVLLLGGTVLLFLGATAGGLHSGEPWPRRLLLCFFHSAAARTSGFVLQPLDSMSSANVLTLTCLMFIGGGPASVGGGVTTSTLAVLSLTFLATIRGRKAVTYQGRTLPTETILKASALVTAAIVFVIAIAWLLLMTQPARLDEALFESISAFSTCGYTLGLTPRLNLFGQLLIAFTMFVGRLGMLTLVVALTREKIEPLRYPEEKILIG